MFIHEKRLQDKNECLLFACLFYISNGKLLKSKQEGFG